MNKENNSTCLQFVCQEDKSIPILKYFLSQESEILVDIKCTLNSSHDKVNQPLSSINSVAYSPQDQAIYKENPSITNDNPINEQRNLSSSSTGNIVHTSQDNIHNNHLHCITQNTPKWESFCNLCNERLCEQCEKAHLSHKHNITALHNNMSEHSEYSSFIEKYQGFEERYLNNLTEIKNYIIAEINKQYDYNYRTNKALFSLVNNQINTYAWHSNLSYNYNVVTNMKYIIDNFNFGWFYMNNVYSTKKKEKYFSMFLGYLRNNLILKIKPKEFICSKTKKYDWRVYGICKWDDVKYAFGYGDKFIRIQNFETFQIINTWIGHDHAVSSIVKLKTKSNCIATSSWDKTWRLWNYETGDCLGVLIGHTKLITGFIELSNSTWITCSHDMMIKTWDLNTLQCLGSFRDNDHLFKTEIIQLRDKRIMTGSKYLKMWEEEMRSVNDIVTTVNLKKVIGTIWEWEDGKIAVGSEKTIYILDPDELKILSEWDEHLFNINKMIQLSSRVLVSSSSDDTVKVWNLYSNECTQTLSEHTKFIHGWCKWNKNVMLTGGDDRLLKWWIYK